MTDTTVLVPDVHLPIEDKRAVKAVINFIGEYNPGQVICTGDLMDYPQPSRWSKDTRAEFEGSVFDDSEYAKRKFLEPLRAVYSGPVRVIAGNHDERPADYLNKWAPALLGSDSFDLDTMLDFNGFGIEKLPAFFDLAPGWMITHGHRGGIRLNQKPGQTALGAATSKFQKSVIMGHTHRLGLLPQSYGYGGKVTKTLWGFEVGNLVDMSKAQYLKDGSANWQQGFGIVHVDGNSVHPIAVPIKENRFVVDGNVFKI
jgi:predicted phosphodiesterase